MGGAERQSSPRHYGVSAAGEDSRSAGRGGAHHRRALRLRGMSGAAKGARSAAVRGGARGERPKSLGKVWQNL